MRTAVKRSLTARAKPTRAKQSEDSIQIMLIGWFCRAYPKAAPWLHHSPNGGARAKLAAVRFKRMGVRAGFPDLVLYLPRGIYVGLAIELKSETGQPTAEQKRWLDHLQACNYRTAVCKGFDEAQAEVRAYMGVEA